MPPARKLEWLFSQEAIDLVNAGVLQFNQLTAEENRLQKEKSAVRTLAPTPACVDDWERGQAFPPIADDRACRMRRARHVVDEPTEARVMWPAYYVVGDGFMYERAIIEMKLRQGERRDAQRDRGMFTTESPSAIAIQGAELNARAGIQVGTCLHRDFELETEDPVALQAQINRYMAAAGGTVRKIVV